MAEKIVITSTRELNADQLANSRALIYKVQQHDQTHRDPYLSNRFNYAKDMPAFFLAVHENQLIGLLTLYADEDPSGVVDVTIHVAANWRKQGIARQLWTAARSVLHHYGYHQVEFLTEKAFLKKEKTFLASNGLSANPVSEFQMSLILQGSYDRDHDLQVSSLKETDIPVLLPAYTEAFPDSSDQEAERYLRENLKAADSQGYVCRYHNRVIGYCAVDFGDYDYLFGLFIRKADREQGLGCRFVSELTRQLANNGHRSFKLGVESDNPAAHHVYRKAGFLDESEIFYLQTERGFWSLEAHK